MDQNGMALSGGMKRRLMIARALIHEPQFLILDEPTAGVDVELRRGMWDYLKKLTKAGVTILLTTHYLEEAEQLHVAIINKDRSSPMDHGRILTRRRAYRRHPRQKTGEVFCSSQ
jgi:ABC-type multidrug transport system ATPase subunit